MAQLSECVVNDVAGTAELSSHTRHHFWVLYCWTSEVLQSMLHWSKWWENFALTAVTLMEKNLQLF